MASQYQVWKCNSCGNETEKLLGSGPPAGCPACGRKILRPVKVVMK